MTYNMFVKF